MAKNTCGPHTELVSNDAVRITRCTCGMVHVTIQASGVTVRMPQDAFRNVAAGMGVAAEKLVEKIDITSTGSTSIN